MSERDYGKCGMRIEYELDEQTMEIISDNIGHRGAHCFGYYCNACDWRFRCKPTPPYVLLDDVRCCSDGLSLRFDIVRYLNFHFEKLEGNDIFVYPDYLVVMNRMKSVLGFLRIMDLLSKDMCDRFFDTVDDLYDKFVEERGFKDGLNGEVYDDICGSAGE